MTTRRLARAMMTRSTRRHVEALDRIREEARRRGDALTTIAIEQRINRDIDGALIALLSR